MKRLEDSWGGGVIKYRWLIIATAVIQLIAMSAVAEESSPRTQNETTLDACRDRQDNDGDGHVDCDDQDCEIFAICSLASGEKDKDAITGDAESSQDSGESRIAEPSRYRHDGLFVRTSFGYGVGAYLARREVFTGEEDSPYPHRGNANWTGVLTASVGGSVSDRTIIHGEFTGIRTGNDKDDGEFGFHLFGFGLGITHYSRRNAFTTFAVGPAHGLMVNWKDDEYKHGVGGMIKLTVGREWPVVDVLGLGFGIQGHYAIVSDGNDVAHQLGGSMLFTISYN